MARARLKAIIEDGSGRIGSIWSWAIQILIIASIISFTIETIPDLDPALSRTLAIFEIVIVIIFSIEYVLRVYVSDKKLSYIFSFYGIIDLLAIAPFYLSFGIDLRSVRIFRLFRLLRLLKLARYNAAIRRFTRAIEIVGSEFILFLFITAGLLYLSAVGIYFFENAAQPENFKSVPHSLWWAVTTLTTVGYGDIYPITLGGRVFTFFVLMLGLGVVAIPAGLFASALAKVRDEDEQETNS